MASEEEKEIRGHWRIFKDPGKDTVISLKNMKSEKITNLWERMLKILGQRVDIPVLELPGAMVVPGAMPVVPETQRV